MPINILCGNCNVKLNAPDAAAGKKVNCPKCATLLVIPRPDPESDFEVMEDEPTPKPAKLKPKPLLLDQDDEDTAPPKKPGKKQVFVDVDEEEDEPKLKKKKAYTKPAAKNNSLLFLIGGGVLGFAVVGLLVYWFALREPGVVKGPDTKHQDTKLPGTNQPPDTKLPGTNQLPDTKQPDGNSVGNPGSTMKWLPTDLTKYGFPLSLDLPSKVSISKLPDPRGTFLMINPSITSTIGLAQPGGTISNIGDWKKQDAARAKGFKLIEDKPDRYLGEFEDEDLGKGMMTYFMGVEIESAGKKYLIHATVSARSRQVADFYWSVLNSAKAK